MIARKVQPHNALGKALPLQLVNERRQIVAHSLPPRGRSIRNPRPAVRILDAHVIIGLNAAAGRSLHDRAIGLDPKFIRMFLEGKIRIGIATDRENAQGTWRDAKRILNVPDGSNGIESGFGPIPTLEPVRRPVRAAHRDALHHQLDAFAHHRSRGESLHQNVLAERALGTVSAGIGNLAVDDEPCDAVNLFQTGVMVDVHGELPVELGLLNPFGRVIVRRPRLKVTGPFRIRSIKILGEPILPSCPRLHRRVQIVQTLNI